MIHALWFVFRLAALLAVVLWFQQEPGDVTVVWLGYEIKTSVGILLAAVAAVALVWSFIDRSFRFILNVPRAWRRQRVLQLREKGYRALTSGFVAVAAGDAVAAARSARVAEQRIGDVPLTILLSAQAAQLNGDAVQARRLFGDLLAHESASFLGLRGLLAEKARIADHSGALELVQQAAEKEPSRRWVLQQLYALEIKNGHWLAALDVLTKVERLRLLPPAAARDQRVTLLLAAAEDAQKKGRSAEQQKLSLRAWRLNPESIPAAAAWADILARFDRKKEAQKVLRRAYDACPHPDVESRWMAFYEDAGKQSPYQRDRRRYEWAQKLVENRLGHRQAQRFLGRVALAAGLWREAEEHLLRAADAESLKSLSRQSGRAIDAPDMGSFPAWVCQGCGYLPETWRPVCPRCQMFHAFEWMLPGAVPASQVSTGFLRDASWIKPPL